MIVQPASLGPRSPRRRALRAAAVAIPLVVLTGVVGLGLAGPDLADRAVSRPGPSASAQAAAVEPSSDPAQEASPEPDLPAKVVFPGLVAGLEVHGVEWTLEARSRGLARGTLVAIAGYLALHDQPSRCVAGGGRTVTLPFCERTGVLAGEPWGGRVASEGRLPPYHLHAQIPPGVRVPYLASGAIDLGGPAQPVVVLARFDDPRAEACVPGGRHCGQELVVERVAWLDGDTYPGTVAVDPTAPTGAPPDAELGSGAREVVARELPGGYPLLVALVRRETLLRMDPGAGAAVPPDVSDDPLWYVRGLREPGDPSRIEWLVVDREGGRLAAGSIALRGATMP